MDTIIIGSLITGGATIIAGAFVLVTKKRKKNSSDQITLELSEIEIKNKMRSISKKVKLPTNLIKDSKILNERLLSFDDKLFNSLQNKEFEKIQPIDQEPELFAAYAIARTKYAQWGDKINIDLLIRLLIERLKAFNNSEEIYYDQALNKIDLITSNQLKFITLHQSIFGLITFLATQNPEFLPDLKILITYLSDEFPVTTLDLDHLISLGLINDITPYRYPELETSKEIDNKVLELKNLVDSKILKLRNIKIWNYSLSPVCRIISSLNIKELLKPSDIGFIYPERQLADFFVKNLYASEEVTAFATKDK